MFQTKKRIILASSLALSVTFGLLIYFVLVLSGVINLVQRNLIFSSGSDEMIYDGETTLYCHEYELISGNLYIGHWMDVEYLSSIDTIGEVDNEIVVTIYDSNNNVVSSKYEITYAYGSLKISSVPLRIATESSSKIYDGEKLQFDSWRLLSGSVLDGHEMTVDVVGEITNVGVTDNEFILTVIDKYGVDVTELYTVIKQLGSLEVTPKTVTVRTNSNTKMYDGTSLEALGYNIVTETVYGDTLYVTPIGTITEVGSINNDIEWYVLNSQNIDVSSNYQINLICGELKVIERYVYIITSDQSKVYDGINLITNENEVVVNNLLSNHDYNFESISDILNAGTTENKVVLSIYDKNTLEDVTYLYNQIIFSGNLTIAKVDIEITTDSSSKEYDGTELINTNYSVVRGLIGGDYLNVVYNESLTNPNSIDNILLFSVFNDEEEITNNYNFIIEYGTLSVLKRIIEVNTLDFNYTYTGLEYDLEDESNNVVQIHNIYHEYYLNYQRTVTAVGVYSNVITLSFDNDDNEFYDITYNFGTVTVHKQTIIIQTLSSWILYDDLEDMYPADEIEYSFPYFLINNNEYTTLDDDEDYTNYLVDYNELLQIDGFVTVQYIGTYYNTVNINLLDTKNFELTVILGGITICDEDKELVVITPKDIKVGISDTTISANGYYDVSNNLNGLEWFIDNGYTYTATITGSIDKDNKVSNSIITEFTLLFDDVIVAYLDTETNRIISENYRIQINEGLMVMTDISITVTSDDITKVYDGKELIADSYICENLPDGYNIEVIGSIVNVGSIKPIVKVFDENGNDVTSYCVINNQLGTLTITKQTIVFNFGNIVLVGNDDINSITKIPEYDTELNVEIECIYYGTKPEQYSSVDIENHVNIKIYDINGFDITSNFTISSIGTISSY